MGHDGRIYATSQASAFSPDIGNTILNLQTRSARGLFYVQNGTPITQKAFMASLHYRGCTLGGLEFAKAIRPRIALGTRDLVWTQTTSWSFSTPGAIAPARIMWNIYSYRFIPIPQEREAARELERCGSLIREHVALQATTVTIWREKAVSLPCE